MPGETEEFPFKLCIQNTKELGAIRSEVAELKETLEEKFEKWENHFSELKKNNGLSNKDKFMLYSTGITTLGTIIVELIIRLA